MSSQIPPCCKEDANFIVEDSIGLGLPSFFAKYPAKEWHLDNYFTEWQNINKKAQPNAISNQYQLDLERIMTWKEKPRTIGTYVYDLKQYFKVLYFEFILIRIMQWLVIEKPNAYHSVLTTG